MSVNCRKCVVNFPHYLCLLEFITHWTTQLNKQVGCNLTFGKIHYIVPCLTWQHDIHKKYQRTLWLKQAACRFILQLPCLFLQSLLTICLTVCAALLLEHNCTLPLLSFHSSHPTLCAERGWSYCPCLATHSIIKLFSSYHHSLASYLTSHIPSPFVSLYITCYIPVCLCHLMSNVHLHQMYGHYPILLPSLSQMYTYAFPP